VTCFWEMPVEQEANASSGGGRVASPKGPLVLANKRLRHAFAE
jgi:hypothetical protein